MKKRDNLISLPISLSEDDSILDLIINKIIQIIKNTNQQFGKYE